MAEEMGRRQAELNEAQEMIRRLEEQLKQLQAAKEELEDRQKARILNIKYNLRRRYIFTYSCVLGRVSNNRFVYE